MNWEDICVAILLAVLVLSLSIAAVIVPLNYRAKDAYRKDLVLSCEGNLECIQLILGTENKLGY